MNLMVIDGNLGAGKTLGMTMIAYSYHLKSGCTLYSNYGLKGAYPFRTYEDFLHVAKQKHSICCWDETQIFLDSRMSHNKGVIWLTQLCYYLRKLRCTVMITSPQMDAIDKRIRLITNIYIYAQKDKQNFNYDFYDFQSGKFLKRKSIKKDIALNLAGQLYDTNYIVDPIKLPSSEEEYRNFVEVLKKVNQN